METALKVKYKDVIVGEYAADLMVDGKVIVELKVAREYNPADEPQLLNELKATELEVGLLLISERKRSNSIALSTLTHLVLKSVFHPRSSVAK
jgi:GxxExxY protein